MIRIIIVFILYFSFREFPKDTYLTSVAIGIFDASIKDEFAYIGNKFHAEQGKNILLVLSRCIHKGQKA